MIENKENPFDNFEEIGNCVHAYVSSIPRERFVANIRELLKAPRPYAYFWREKD